MTRKNTRLLSACIGAVFMCLAFTGCGKTSITMEEMVNAGKTDSLLAHYTSFQTQVVFEENNGVVEEYVDSDITYRQEQGYAELYVGGELRYASFDGTLAAVLPIDQEPRRYYLEENSFYAYPSLNEIIKTCRKENGRWYVTTELSAEDMQIWAANNNYTCNEGEKMSISYELDEKTLAPITQKELLVAADGTQNSLLTVTVTYNTEKPDLAKTMLEHLSSTENLRSVTVVVNPDTEEEQTFTMKIPKGDSISIDSPEEYEGFYTDRACTQTLGTSDRNEDITVYLKKVS